MSGFFLLLTGTVFILRRLRFVRRIDLVRSLRSRLDARISRVQFQTAFLNLLVDLLRRFEERVLNILACFGGSFAEVETVFAGEFASFFCWNIALIFQIRLVANQKDDSIWRGMVRGVCEPRFQMIKCLPSCDIVNHDGT